MCKKPKESCKQCVKCSSKKEEYDVQKETPFTTSPRYNAKLKREQESSIDILNLGVM
jgi:hypothetical protein